MESFRLAVLSGPVQKGIYLFVSLEGGKRISFVCATWKQAGAMNGVKNICQKRL